jgi:hypothetical protein
LLQLEVHEVDQGAVHVHHDFHVRHVQGQAHGEVQEGHKANKSDHYAQEVVLDALRWALSYLGCSPCSP